MTDSNKYYRNQYRIPSTRRPGYDYGTPGYYFVTIITKNRIRLFGDPMRDHRNRAVVVLSDIGRVAATEWRRTAELRPYVQLDEWVVMPDHVHGIVVIRNRGAGESVTNTETDGDGGANGETVETHSRASLRDTNTTHIAEFGPQRHNLPSIIRGFKTAVTTNVRRSIDKSFAWQSRYHDRIIRNRPELERIRRYIRNNPEQWMGS